MGTYLGRGVPYKGTRSYHGTLQARAATSAIFDTMTDTLSELLQQFWQLHLSVYADGACTHRTWECRLNDVDVPSRFSRLACVRQTSGPYAAQCPYMHPPDTTGN